MITMKPLKDVEPGETIALGIYEIGTVLAVETVEPAPGDEYVYDDFRGSGKPYLKVTIERFKGFSDQKETVVRYSPMNAQARVGEGL